MTQSSSVKYSKIQKKNCTIQQEKYNEKREGKSNSGAYDQIYDNKIRYHENQNFYHDNDNSHDKFMITKDNS